MFDLLMQIDVKPEHCEAFIAAMSGHAQRARANGAGTVRLDVSVDNANPNRLFLYEAYMDEAAFKEHGQGASVAQFRAESAGWAEASAVIGRATTVFPPDSTSY